MLSSLRDTRRRAKESMLQSLGLTTAADDSDFQAGHAEYKATVASLRALQASMRAHLDAVKKMHESGSRLAAELAAFHRDTLAADAAADISRAHAEVDAAVAAAERLYEEEVVAAVDLLLWQTPEVEERVKQRRTFLLDYNAHRRKYETARSALSETQNSGMGSGSAAASGSFMSRRKSENEIVEDVATRKVRVDQAEAAVTESTAWLEQQFADLAQKREAGEILQGPMRALVACEFLVARRLAKSLDTVGAKLVIRPMVETLTKYETELAPAMAAARAAANAAAAGAEGGQENAYHHSNRHHHNGSTPGKAHHHHHHSSSAAAANNNNDLDRSDGSDDGVSSFGGSSGGSSAAVFGRDLHPSAGVPSIVLECVSYLQSRGLSVEGLFRVPGSSEVVHELRERYDSGETNVVASVASRCDPADIATLLKLFFRDLPTPLIPNDAYAALLDASLKAQEERDAARRAQLVCDAALQYLPPINVSVLGVLLPFLQRVARNSEQNKMTTTNLATCFAPTLLRAPDDASPVKVLSDMQLAIFAMKVMIEEAHRFPSSGGAGGEEGFGVSKAYTTSALKTSSNRGVAAASSSRRSVTIA